MDRVSDQARPARRIPLSTFIVRVMKFGSGKFSGYAEHVRSGEKASFSSDTELCSFLERMSASEVGGRWEPMVGPYVAIETPASGRKGSAGPQGEREAGRREDPDPKEPEV